jgi:hypothetical protein
LRAAFHALVDNGDSSVGVSVLHANGAAEAGNGTPESKLTLERIDGSGQESDRVCRGALAMIGDGPRRKRESP